jgi:hypothetical protein
MSRLNLWYLPPAFFSAGGPWGRPAPGIPCALFCFEGNDDESLGRQWRREKVATWLVGMTLRRAPIHRCHRPRWRAIQYAAASRSITTLSEYWIARTSRAMTVERLMRSLDCRAKPSVRRPDLKKTHPLRYV